MWPMVIFYSLLNIGAINSQIIHFANGNASKVKSRRHFLKTLSLDLIEEMVKVRTVSGRMLCEMKEKASDIFYLLEPGPSKKPKIGERHRCKKCQKEKKDRNLFNIASTVLLFVYKKIRPDSNKLIVCDISLAADHYLTSLGPGFHDVAEHTIACTADSKTTNQLVTEGLALCNGTQTPRGNLLSEEIHRVVLEVEPLLDNRGELTDTTALLPKHILCTGGQDDDLCAQWSHTHFNPAVALLCQLTAQELIQLSLEHSICHKLTQAGC
ncbi:hypothetical protein LAZ67_6002856 [Cordylochernes scorpioides]|uniref:Uncharacterized protein n=1 Tax=Cordylochernes scorpioides TaxID=51811 RepID=A0ABY6KK35_9ARAC|nr:hypothetical protein LAZ67_6002856 [Cordylochernes scorpioides]